MGAEDPMDIYEALYTTRAMRRMKLDPIPRDVQQRMLDAAIRAPTGGNMQGWRFMLVDDPGLRGKIAPLYLQSIDTLFGTYYKAGVEQAEASPDLPESVALLKMVRSARHLAEHFAEVPLLLFAFIGNNDRTGGSIFPAVWSAMLAARAEGVGGALTSVLGMFVEAELNALLDVPEGQGWSCACTVAFGYPTGRCGVAPRRPAHEVSCRNGWNGDVGFEIPGPLWSA
jgi:nitroreductase